MLLNFQPRFVPYIIDGSKTHTIRAIRRVTPRVGDTCHCYTGLRRPGAQLLGRWPCVKVEDIRIFEEDYVPRFLVDAVELSLDEKVALAWRDGFRSSKETAFAEMMAFWDQRLPFTGHIIHWSVNKQHTIENFSMKSTDLSIGTATMSDIGFYLVACPVCTQTVRLSKILPFEHSDPLELLSYHTRGVGISTETGLPIERRRCPGSNCSIAAAEAVANDE
jgi:hypothetical protein